MSEPKAITLLVSVLLEEEAHGEVREELNGCCTQSLLRLLLLLLLLPGSVLPD
jgi:hypothetical protein